MFFSLKLRKLLPTSVQNIFSMKEGWKYKRLEECFDYIKNGANIKQERGASGIPITRIETLSGGVFNRDRLGYANLQELGKYKSYVLDSGDILLSHINSKTYIGRIVVYVKEGDETIIHGMNLLRLKARQDILNPFYMHYYSFSNDFKEQVANRRKDAVNQSSISVGDLKTIRIPVPSLPEQENIVAELDCLSDVIEKQKQQLKELDNLAQAIFYDIFGDPITNEKGWKVKPLGDACGFQQGEQVPIEEQFEVYEEGMVRFLRIVDFTQGNEKPRYVMCKNTKHILQNEQVAIVRYGTPGFVCFGKSGLIANNLFKIIPKSEDIAFRFLVYWLYSDAFQSVIKDNQYGVALQAIKFSTIKDINLIIPPINLQQEFASKIEAIEKQKELIKQSLSETETLFNSRMDYYFN